jgi:SAM-dependent methyltransferase
VVEIEDQYRANDPPARCLLCNDCKRISPAGFRQLYPQQDSESIPLRWWECDSCRGWFVYPVPEPYVIERYWPTIAYLDPKLEIQIATAKEDLQRRILTKLSHSMKPSSLLDFGCNFGQFLCSARDAGWTPSGFEPNQYAAEYAHSKGFDVRTGWLLEKAGFHEASFDAITATDTFCYAWNPSATLRIFYDLLRVGGILVMRLTNKRFVLGIARMLMPKGSIRDRALSRILQGQFHSVRMSELERILVQTGFDHVEIEGGATTDPSSAHWGKRRIAYRVADIICGMTYSKVNLSPGVLVFARKS